MPGCKVHLAVCTRNAWSNAGAQVHSAYGLLRKKYSQPVDTTPEPEVDAAPAKRLWLPPNSCWLAAVTTCPAAAELGAAASASPAAGDAAGSTISGS